eukprot:1984_1
MSTHSNLFEATEYRKGSVVLCEYQTNGKNGKWPCIIIANQIYSVIVHFVGYEGIDYETHKRHIKVWQPNGTKQMKFPKQYQPKFIEAVKVANAIHKQQNNTPIALRKIRLLLDAKNVGGVIGKNGVSITQIRQKSQANIFINKPVLNSLHRICIITGAQEQIITAIYLISNKIFDTSAQMQYHNISLLIEALNIGYIIGKKGKTIRNIRESTNANISISRDLLYCSSEKTVDISGERGQVHDAVKMIVEKLFDNVSLKDTRLVYDPLAIKYETKQFEAMQASCILFHLFEVDSDLIGVIIGTGGRNIEEIRRQTGAVIKIDQNKENHPHKRRIMIQGTSLQISTAIFMIQASINISRN